MSEMLDAFRKEYDVTGDLSFAGVHYRDGAPFSTSWDGTPIRFGLCEGFRNYSAGLQWGWVRFHMGVDRAAGIVRCPFDCDCPRIETDETTREVYGSLVRLPTEYGFEVRIAHMDPAKDIRLEVVPCLTEHLPIARGTVLGHAGGYGIGAGAHTHTEIVSIEDRSPLLDEILLARYGESVGREYSMAEVVGEYRRHEMFAHESDASIMHDYARERREKGVVWCNRFRATFGWDHYAGGVVTRYSSQLLFGM